MTLYASRIRDFSVLLFLCALSMSAQTPSINPGGIIGAGLSSTPVTAVSPGALVSIFGSGFAKPGASYVLSGGDVANGKLPVSLGGVCVQFDSVFAPVLAVVPTQINVQAPAVAGTTSSIRVLTGCGTASQKESDAVSVRVAAVTPEFLYFSYSGSGSGNPIAAYNPVRGNLLGKPGLVAGLTFAPAAPGDIVTLFATGLGAVKPAVSPGQLAASAAPITQAVAITIGGEAVASADLFYVGVAPQYAGLYQINLRIPPAVSSGTQKVTMSVGGVRAPDATLTITTDASYSLFPTASVGCGNDPANDDSARIHAALATTGFAVLPANQTCFANLAGSNAIPSGSLLLGVPGRSILKPFSRGQPIIDVQGLSPSRTLDNITISGITFDGVGANLANARSGLLSFRFLQNLRFTNNVIRSTGNVNRGEALLVVNSSAVIDDNDISNFGNQVDIFLDGDGRLPPNASIVVSHNRIRDNSPGGGDGIWVHGAENSAPVDFPVLVQGNYVANTNFTPGDTGATGNAYHVYRAQKVRFAGNSARNSSFSCFRSISANDIVFTGNSCDTTGETAAYSEFSSQRNQWINNFIRGAASNCMNLTNFVNQVSGQQHVAIGNHLQNCGGWGIEAEGYVVLSGNVIDHTARAAIQIGFGPTSQYVLAKGNLIIDSNPGAPGATPLGICVEHGDGEFGHVVEGNQILISGPAIAGCDHGDLYDGGKLPSSVTVRNQSISRAQLGTPADGTVVYVPDAAPGGDCSAAGSGAFARRAHSAWSCN